MQEAYGGAGLGDLDVAIILEELAWGDVGVALTYVGHWLALAPLIRGGSDDQRRRWLPRIAASPDGSFLAAICATEHGSAGDLTPRDYLGAEERRGGIEPQDFFTNYTLPRAEQREMTTKAIRDGDEYVINGTKRFITNGPVAGMYLCIATVDPSLPDALATRAFLVPAGAPGLSVGTLENKMGHRLSITSEIIFENVRVPAEDDAARRRGRAALRARMLEHDGRRAQRRPGARGVRRGDGVREGALQGRQPHHLPPGRRHDARRHGDRHQDGATARLPVGVAQRPPLRRAEPRGRDGEGVLPRTSR